MRAILVTLLAALLVVGTACDREEPAPTASANLTSPVAAPSPTADPYQSPWARFGRMTINASSGAITKVIQRDEINVLSEPRDAEFTAVRPCSAVGESVRLGHGRVSISGHEYNANCGYLSPGGRFMYYGAHSALESEGWVLRLTDGSRFQVAGTFGCGSSCDGGTFGYWSWSGRYLWYFDAGARTQESSTWRLLDAESALIIRAGSVGVWSPTEDAYAQSGAGVVLVTRLPSGEVSTYADITGRVAFDDDGRYLISVDGTTVVVDLKSAAVVARWLGKPQQMPYERSFAAFEGAPIGLMEFAEGCDGILAYHPLLSGSSRCLKGVKGAVWSPDRRSIAFSRFLRQGSSSSMVTDDRWSAVILDIGSGREIEAARDLRSDFQPFLRWNTEGTRLLVEWPGFRPGI